MSVFLSTLKGMKFKIYAFMFFTCILNIYFLASPLSTTTNTIKTSINYVPSGKNNNLNYAIAHFYDGGSDIYGLYSIKNQLEKFDMTPDVVSHIVVVSENLDENLLGLIETWIGKENVRKVNKSYVLDKIRDDARLWSPTFNKLWLFNLTEFDKVVTLDLDILIRTNIMHWFDYPTPCGIQPKDTLAWNSGSIVIEPSTDLFEEMLSVLPSLERFQPEKDYSNRTDPHIMGYGQQDFVNVFFNQDAESMKKRCVMPTEAAVLSSSLSQRDEQSFAYFKTFRKESFQTVHFTVHKPRRKNTRAKREFVCDLLQEWNQSLVGIEEYYPGSKSEFTIDPIGHDYLLACNETNGL